MFGFTLLTHKRECLSSSNKKSNYSICEIIHVKSYIYLYLVVHVALDPNVFVHILIFYLV